MKKIYLVMLMLFMTMTMSAQAVVKTDDGKYDAYCEMPLSLMSIVLVGVALPCTISQIKHNYKATDT